MNIEVTKVELAKIILESENPIFLQKVADFVSKENTDFWNEIPLKDQKEILEGIEQLNSGKRIDFYDTLLKMTS